MIIIEYLDKLTGILFRPLQALEQYKSEEGMGKPLQFMLISVAIAACITVIFEIIKGQGLMGLATVFGISLVLDIIVPRHLRI